MISPLIGVQDQYPHGHSLVGVIAASDKTPLTIGTGNKELHPLLLSIANIRAGVRMKATSHAFVLAAYLPIPKFVGVRTELQSMLSARVFHRSLDHVFINLKAAERCGAVTSDGNGWLRTIHTPLVAFIADRPEQLMIAGVNGRTSPISLATTNQFDDPYPHPPRTRQHTLDAIRRVLLQCPNPWDLVAFAKACERENLNGVYEPFWRDWGSAEPSIFLTPEALHQWHKFFYDHCLKWVINIMTGEELDFRLSVLQPRVGVKHWKNGVSKLKQCTGREHRDLETQLVTTAAGAVPHQVLCAIRAMIDFIFQAQNLSHCNETLHALSEALREFHHYRQAIISAGGRRGKKGPIPHFRIPKLEAMQHVVRSIRAMGSAYQWTSDVTERCHITHAKTPYRHSNHVNFHQQCCRFLDRDEKRRFFHLYVLLKDGQHSLLNEMKKESVLMSSHYPEASWITHISPDDKPIESPRIPRNLFMHKRSVISDASKTALYVNRVPHLLAVSVDEAAHQFHIPDLRSALGDFLSGKSYSERRGQRLSSANCNLPFERLNIWFNFKLQCKSAQDASVVCPPSTVQSLPPADQLPYGRCNTVLVAEDDQTTDVKGERDP
jgi:hypothetical protein